MRSVVFDLDGTLADTSADLLAAANACFTDMGHAAPLGPADAITAFAGGRAMLRLGSDRLALGWDEAAIATRDGRLLEVYAEVIVNETRLYPGAVAAVERLRAEGIAAAVCTNKPVDLADVLLRRLGVRDLFAVVVGAGSLAVRKPDPAPLHHTLALMGGDRRRTVLIGDTITDRETGRNAGIPVTLVTFGPEGAEVARHAPEALLDHYDDLDRIVAPFIGRP